MENMQLRLNCTIMARAYSKYYKLVWLKGDTFVSFGDLCYLMWSSEFHCDANNTQESFLAIRRVVCPATYNCALMSTTGKIVDSKTYHIFVTKGKHLFKLLVSFTTCMHVHFNS